MHRKILAIGERLGLINGSTLPKVQKVNHTRVGEGTLEISKLTEGRADCWAVARVTKTPAVKFNHHIICDPLGKYDEEYWEAFNHECNIYILIGDELKQVKTLEELRENVKYATHASKPKVKKIASQYQLSADQIKILDYGAGLELRHELFDTLPYARIHLTDFINCDEEKFYQLIETIPKNLPVLISIDCEKYSSQLPKFALEINKMCKVEGLQTDFGEKANIIPWVCSSLLHKFWKQVAVVSIVDAEGITRGTGDDEWRYNYLKYLKIKSSTEVISLKDILKYTTKYQNLETLSINGNIVGELDEKESAPSQQSFELTIEGTIDLSVLINLLKKYPNISGLTLKCNITNTKDMHHMLCCSQALLLKLKKLVINTTNIGDEPDAFAKYAAFLIRSNYKTLEIVNVKNNGSFKLGNVGLQPAKKLRELTLNGSIAQNDILKFISESSDLEKLDIDVSDTIEHKAEDFLKVSPYPKLEKVTLRRVSEHFLRRLVPLKQASVGGLNGELICPVLRTLELHSVWEEKVSEKFVPTGFPELREITVDESQLGNNSEKLVTAALPELREIIVDECQLGNYMGELLRTSRKLKNVQFTDTSVEDFGPAEYPFQTLTLSDSSLRSKIFAPVHDQLRAYILPRHQGIGVRVDKHLPQIASHVQRLEITDNRTFASFNQWLPELTELKIGSSYDLSVTHEVIGSVISRAPNLKTLTIYGTTLITISSAREGKQEALALKMGANYILKPVGSLSRFAKIEELNLSYVNLLTDTCEPIFEQLKVLSITHCNFKKIDERRGDLTPLNLKVINFDCEECLSITEQIDYLCQLLNRCKNLEYLTLHLREPDDSAQLKQLHQALAGRSLKYLEIKGLRDEDMLPYKKEYPHGIYQAAESGPPGSIDLRGLSSDSKRISDSFVAETKAVNHPTHEVRKEIGQKEKPVYHLKRYIHPTDLSFTEYRQAVYTQLKVIKGKLVRKLSETKPVECKQQPKRVAADLYNEYLNQRTKSGSEYYYVEQVLQFPPQQAALPGVTPDDEIIAYQADAPVTFLKNEETKQYYGEAKERKEVRIAYLLKNKKPYRRNVITKDTFNTEYAEKLVANFEFTYDEKAKKFKIKRNGECSKVDDITLFKHAIALTTDGTRWGPTAVKNKGKNFDIISKLEGTAFLEAIRKNCMGSCEHQAAFIKALADALSIPCHIITNNCHAFVQFSLIENQRTVTYSERLGGYPGETHIYDEMPGKLFEGHDTQPAQDATPKIPGPASIDKQETVATDEKKTDEVKQEVQVNIQPKEEMKEEKKDEIPKKITFNTFYDNLMAKLEEQSSTEKTGLLYVSDAEQSLITCVAKLMEQAKEHKQSCFYIDDISDANKRSLYVNDAGKGKIVGSDLRQFLDSDHPDKVLVIRCPKDFSSRALIYNALDGSRHIKGMKIPAGVKIVCIVDKHNITTEHAFQRRFKVKPRDKNDLLDQQVQWPAEYISENFEQPQPADEKACIVKDLCGGDGIQEDIYGTINFSEEGIEYQPGLVHEIINSTVANPLVKIINAGDSRELKLALLNLQVTGRAFVNGEWKTVPPFRVCMEEVAYDFSDICEYKPLTDENRKQCQLILNPQTYPTLLRNYGRSEKTRHLISTKGLLSAYAGQSLTVRATKSLAKPGHWKRFFDEAKRLKIKLRLVVDPGVEIPGVNIPAEEKLSPIMDAKLVVHRCAAPYDMAAAVKDKVNAKLVVNVCPKHHYTDLIQTLDPIEAKATDELPCYELTTGDVLDRLRKGENVLLVGDLSDELAGSLETLLANPPYLMVNGAREELSGRLHVLTHPSQQLQSALQQVVNVVEKKASLEQKSLEEKIRHEDKDNDNEQDVRMRLLCTKMNESPCVLLEGPTAAGKTTAIRRYLQGYYQKYNKKPITLFNGLSCLKDFASFTKEDKTDHVLFIDENDLLDEGALEMFESAYNPVNPHALANTKVVPWTDRMKVVFAGNGKTYEGRKIHEFVQRHKEMRMEFKPLSQQYIKKYILKSLLKTLHSDLKDSVCDQMIDIFFDASQFVNKPCVVTLRNWSQMCLRLALRPKVAGDCITAAKIAAYDELNGMLFADQRAVLQTNLFGSVQKCKELVDSIDQEAAKTIQQKLAQTEQARRAKDSHRDPVKKFVLTRGRYHAARMIADSLAIRNKRLQLLDKCPDIQYQGTFGLVLTGDSEAGKTDLVREILQALDFQEEFGTPTGGSQKFYSLTADNIEEKSQAFNVGMPCLFNEYNATFNEEQDNPLLSGWNPEGNPAKKPGFIMFATNNGLDHSERLAPTEAAANRSQEIELLPYTRDDYFEILVGWGLSTAQAQQLVEMDKLWKMSDLQDEARKMLKYQISEDKASAASIVSSEAHQKAKTEVKLPAASHSHSWMWTLLKGVVIGASIALACFFPAIAALKVLAGVLSGLGVVNVIASCMSHSRSNDPVLPRVHTPDSTVVLSRHMTLSPKAHDHANDSILESQSSSEKSFTPTVTNALSPSHKVRVC